jgi:hypothetical protein
MTHRFRLAALLALAAAGCQQGSTEEWGSPIQVDSVDARLTASDTRTGATVTVDFAPPGAAQSGTTPVSITETVNTTGQTVVPVDVADDAVPANRYTAGRIEIR